MLTTQIELKPKVKTFLEGNIELFINGKYMPSVSGKKFETYNPATEEVLALVSEAQEEDVDLAVKAARKAFEKGDWPDLSAAERARLIYKFADLIEENREELAQLEALDNGKPYEVALNDDIPATVEHYRYYAGWATKILGQTFPISKNYLNYTRHEPIGVVGQIIPWNYPLVMSAWKMGAALATGCTIVLKPAEQTPLSLMYTAQLIKEAGFPDGVINFVPGFGQTAGTAIVNHPDVDKIAFTGSTVTGKYIMRQAAETVKHVTLELGGKSPNIILEDADLTEAIPGAFNGIMYNHGQNCSAGSRIFVHRKHYDRVVEELAKMANEVKLGAGMDKGSEMGPLVSEKQFERVLGYIEKGKAEGAKVAAGGERVFDKGYFVKPTIFADVTDDMTIAKEEIFGPVVAVLPFDTVEEVIERANNTPYGLAAGVWTENVKTAHYVANKLKAGTVWINDYNLEDAAAPFGGYKQSGIGREMGSYALDNYTEVKCVWVKMK
ncbi:aldehyde dehydrogenase family protein [Heyndrickxia sporothermodurans]|uniref:aldehyde dehydrogenase family protein n=1 Tax=Heyndrickxia sporothermodurans TaxID=46224 RepID=UPI002DBFFDCC|nr:aldehyde dehydrogenase family protein [Heyndrickxia sporothermodurans]MEB6548597.1 aldehyde dehydrogenase family protein [Heyndrickxia sporothermodurans]MED3651835.1 aldehyde dehydrogenase family protein [Heyndrickxia sporothermodurans]MED3653596.1 aldehyde dehydrogenase family protein [Heyndrickxia sporothermodurans]MED3699551.1 aldehyde dehydrogenase family protein [Heyndrickxia sporothermodurans]MED3782428.1 aldehyde dehydrogenase family protein [Heyndrickxia sporothermodurans]